MSTELDFDRTVGKLDIKGPQYPDLFTAQFRRSNPVMIYRRQVLQWSASVLAYPILQVRAEPSSSATPATPTPTTTARAPATGTLPLIQRPIPSSGELLPVMGMGTSRTFDTPGDPASRTADRPRSNTRGTCRWRRPGRW